MSGFAQVPARVLLDPVLTPEAKVVFGVLALRDIRKDGKVWPSLATIAEDASLSISTVQRALRRLQDARYVAVQRHGGNRANTYFLLVRVVGGKVMEWSPTTAPDRSSATTEVEQAKQRKNQKNEGSDAPGIHKRSGSSREEPDANVVPLRGRVAR